MLQDQSQLPVSTASWLLLLLPAIFGFLGTIIGGLITGGGTAVVKWIELREMKKSELRRFRLERLEAVFVSLTELMEASRLFSHRIVILADPTLSDEQRRRGYVDLLDGFQNPSVGIATKMSLYTRGELDGSILIQDIVEIVEEAHKFIDAHMVTAAPADGRLALQAFKARSIKVGEDAIDFQEKISNIIDKLLDE